MKSAVVSDLKAGKRIEPGKLLDELELFFPLLGQLASTPQDPEWHAEGNVRIHTEMVISEAYKVIEEHGLDTKIAFPLLLAAALHDIGKALTTREEELKGRIRITSPRHAARGRSYVAPRIVELGLDSWLSEMVLAGIGHHHDPRKLLSGSMRKHKFWRLGRIVDPWFIYLLEIADNRGRICIDGEGGNLERLELFRMACEDADSWRVGDPYSTWKGGIDTELQDQPDHARKYVFLEARRLFEAGKISTQEEAVAITYPHRENHAELVVMCGPAGAGKSCWIEKNLPDHRRISLDNLREKLAGKRSKMSKEGQVMQAAKEDLRKALRGKEKVVWDATSLREDGRAMILGMGHDYHALTRIVAFATTPETVIRRNRKRRHDVPVKVIERQYERMQWPNAWEAHTMDVVC